MLMLLPMLLLTTSASKLVGLDLGLLEATGALPPPPPGPVESLTVAVSGDRTLTLTAGLRTADLGAGAGDVRLLEQSWPPVDGAMDLAALQSRLRELKALDGTRERLLLTPDDAVPARAVVLVMDAVRSDRQGPLYPEVVLAAEPAPEAP